MNNSQLVDTKGRLYELLESTDEEQWVFHLKTDGYPLVGYANCIVNSDGELLLTEIMIKDKVIPVSPTIPTDSSSPQCQVSFRSMGVGSALLNHILKTAQQRGLRKVTGRIFWRDLSERPWIPIWYTLFGFEVVQNNDGFTFCRNLHALLIKETEKQPASCS